MQQACGSPERGGACSCCQHVQSRQATVPNRRESNMPKPSNPNQNAQNVHSNLPEQAIDAQLAKYDISDSFGTVDSEAQFGSQMYFGNGNSPNNYHIDQNNTLGFQLDLKEHYRTGDDIAH